MSGSTTVYDALARIHLMQRMRALLLRVATPGTCRHCGQEVFWATTVDKALVPFTRLGRDHRFECPITGRDDGKGHGGGEQ